MKSNTPNRHRFTVETFASAERVQDTYHEKLIEANVKSDLMSPWFIPHFKTAFHAAHVLNSYRVYRGSLRNFWIFSLYVSRHVQALPYLHLITTSETTVFSLPALAQKNSLTKTHVLLSKPLDKLKHVDLIFRCALRLGYIGYTRGIEKTKIDVENIRDNIEIFEPTLALLDAETVTENKHLFEQLLNDPFVFELAIIGEINEGYLQHLRKPQTAHQINEVFTIIQTNSNVKPSVLSEEKYVLFALIFNLLEFWTTISKAFKWLSKPFRYILKYLLNST